MKVWLKVTITTLLVFFTDGGLLNILKRGRRNYQEDLDPILYWKSPVQLGVFINNDFMDNDGNSRIATKRTDTPLHPTFSESGSGSEVATFFSDSAKRDRIPKTHLKPKFTAHKKTEPAVEKKANVEAMKKSELTAKATKVEVQGEEQDSEKATTSITCQGEKEWLQCPQYHLIKINSAFWGRDDKNTCTRSSISHGRKTDKMCAQDESNTMMKVQNACDGESACELVASQVYFDRTDCPDIYKYMRLNWECVHSESRIKDTLEMDRKAAKGTLK